MGQNTNPLSYSNLIDGHNTHPVDIERALKTTTAPIPRSATEEKAAYVPAVVIDGVAPNSRIDIQDCVRMCLVEGPHLGDRDMVLPEEIHGLYARRSPRSSIEI